MLRLILLVVFLATSSCADPAGKQRLICMKKMQSIMGILTTHAVGLGGYPAVAHKDEQGRKIHSWRFWSLYAVASLIDPPEIYEKWPAAEYEEWDDKGARQYYNAFDEPHGEGLTSFLALRGPGTAVTEFGEGRGRCVLNVEPDAIVLVECQSNIHWIQPGDVDIDSILNSPTKAGLGDLKGNYPEGFAVAFADRAVWFLKNSVPASEVGKFFTVVSAKKHDRSEVLGPYVIEKLPPVDMSWIKREAMQHVPCREAVPKEEKGGGIP